jgi:F-type H+-transporting ATPase subunit b
MAIISSAFALEAEHETHETEGAAGTLAEGGAHHEGGFPPFETQNFAPQLVWLALIFGLLYLLMSRIALPRVGAILETREAKISSDLDASREMQAKAQAAAADNERTLRAKREEARGIGRDSQQKIAAAVAAQRASAEKEAADKLRAAEAEITADKERLLADVDTIATEAAASIIQKLTGARVDQATLDAAYRATQPR